MAAEPVSREQGGRTLHGSLELADGASLSDGLILMLHGTMAHHGMEIMQAFQQALKERGHSSLAVTLSLGIDGRQAFYDCKVPSRHRQVDAVEELAGWVDWLKDQQVGQVSLLGHSRGGNQVARYLASQPDPTVKKGILVAPAGVPKPEEAASLLALAEGKPDDALVTAPRFLMCDDTQVSAGSIRGYYQDDGKFDTPDLLADIDVPVLVLAASDDNVVPDLPEKVEALELENLQFQLIEGDHFFRDFAAEDAADAIDAFLAQ
ncbi:alpha/beta hydrolase [Indioceanicola profundi]|uniref:alpha/beta hydrolase n=1 Tax=Indioceanicola profundi TaxID=2220096 RepID=UPI0019690A2C|nr:alpha/beta fold hydrolase [Indioceanicola profundi]